MCWHNTPVLPLYSITSSSSGMASASELTFFARHHCWWEFAFYGDSSAAVPPNVEYTEGPSPPLNFLNFGLANAGWIYHGNI